MRLTTPRFCILTCLLLGLQLTGCNSNDNNMLKADMPQQHHFNSGHNLLDARLIPGKDQQSNSPIIIFIHGDGEMDYTSKSFYKPIFSALSAQNMASFSWSKPGIGDSTGDWLQQSMSDRVREVKDAISYLRNNGYPHNPIGVLGFSQASWVISHLYDEPRIDFITLVGGAANWREQSKYSMWIRLIQQQKIKADNEQALLTIEELNQREYQLLKTDFAQYAGSDLHQHPFMPSPIETEQHFNFVHKNIDADVSFGFSRLNVPLLALYGDSDTHVDIQHSQRVFAESFAAANNPKANLQQKVLSGASHSLLKPDLPLRSLLYISKDDFAPGAIETIVNWFKQQSKTSVD